MINTNPNAMLQPPRMKEPDRNIDLAPICCI